MNKKFKFTSAVLTAGLIITPILGTINQNNNIAEAKQNIKFNDYISKKDTLQKHIDYIDSQISIINSRLVINRENVLNYINKNWNVLKNENYNTPIEYYNNIENSISEMNNKLSSGYYKLTNDKGIIEKYQSREIVNGYERYSKWWGYQYYARGSAGERLASDFEDAAEKRGWGTVALGGVALFSGGVGIPILGIFTAFSSTQFSSIAIKVRRYISYYGSVKVSVYVTGAYYTVEPIK